MEGKEGEAERRKKMHQFDADILVLQSDKKSIEHRQAVLQEEIRRVKIEFAREQKAAEEEARRRKVALERLAMEREKKEIEIHPLTEELVQIEEDIRRVGEQKKDL